MTILAPSSAALDEVTLQTIRRHGIGGSDVPAILNVSPFRTANDVFCDKLGLGPAFVETEPMFWGKKFEPLIAEVYAQREGVRIQWPTPGDPQSRFLKHPVDTWRRATVDYFIAGLQAGVDVKMASPFSRDRWGVAGTDQVPDDYLLQMQWYLDVTGFERWDIAVLLGSELRVYRIHPHPDLQAHLREMCSQFWHEHVLAKVPPAPQSPEDARRQLDMLFPRDRQPIREADAAEVRLVQLLARAQSHLARVEEVYGGLRDRICRSIGDAGGIEGPFGRVTWKKTSPSQRINWESVAHALADIAPTEYQKQCRAHTKSVDGSRRFVTRFDALHCPVPEDDTLAALQAAADLLEDLHV